MKNKIKQWKGKQWEIYDDDEQEEEKKKMKQRRKYGE